MKKKMLIVSSSLNMGGLEKCLVNFCDNLDYPKYDVDLYLFNDGRVLLNELSDQVHVLPDSPYYSDVYNKTIIRGLGALLKQGQFLLALYKGIRFIRTRLHCNLNTTNDWKVMKKTMFQNSKEYDVAIGFEEGSASYYVADCITAKKKICWIHTDVKMIDTNKELDNDAFSKIQWICTVSQNSLQSLRDEYPQYIEKMRCFTLPTMINYQQIDQMALEECEFDEKYINILSVGRLVELKGFQLCIEPLKRLIKEGYAVRWYIAGEGDYRVELEKRVQEEEVEDAFILLGNCSNPYKYISKADICVQPSRYEGFSMAVWEEKYLGKPVVATQIPSNYELLTNEVNGLLIEREEQAIYLVLKRLIENPEFRIQLGKNPANGYRTSLNVMRGIEELIQ